MKKYGDEKIEIAPSAPKLQGDGTSQWMVWRVTVPRQPRSDESARFDELASQEHIRITMQPTEAEIVHLIARQEPVGDYTELYLASIRALYHLEKLIGRLIEIEGIARQKWDVNFLTARQFGPFE